MILVINIQVLVGMENSLKVFMRLVALVIKQLRM